MSDDSLGDSYWANPIDAKAKCIYCSTEMIPVVKSEGSTRPWHLDSGCCDYYHCNSCGYDAYWASRASILVERKR